MSNKYRVSWSQEVVEIWTGTTEAESESEALENVKEGNYHEAELVDAEVYHTFEEKVESLEIADVKDAPFKIGDQIKCVDNTAFDDHIKVGDVYTVTAVDCMGSDFYVGFEQPSMTFAPWYDQETYESIKSGKDTAWHVDGFELVKGK